MNMMVRYSLFGAYLMELEEFRKVKPAVLLQFARTSKRGFINCGYIGNVHWAMMDWPQFWVDLVDRVEGKVKEGGSKRVAN